MNRPTLRSKSGSATRAIVLACTLAFAGAAAAQSEVGAMDPYTPSPYTDTGAYPQPGYGEPPRRQSARSLFAATLVSLIAQGVGSGVSAGLSEGLRGSIVRWFSAKPAAARKPARGEAGQGRKGNRAASAPALQAGMAFEVHRLDRDGAPRAVEPASHVFRTGDRFLVYYRPTLPGRVSVHNVNGQRVESLIDGAEVAAGQLVALGPYEFVDRHGDETLRIVLSPCTTPGMTRTTRSVMKVQGAVATPMSEPMLAGCDGAPAQQAAVRTRSIQRVAMDGTTAFALDPVSEGESASGALAPREVTIRLKHRRPATSTPRAEPMLTASYVQ
jgi:hypothetical protein